MTMSSPLPPIPGSFVFERPYEDQKFPSKQGINFDDRSYIFQPPQTPSASSSFHHSKASLENIQPNDGPVAAGQKRSRQASMVGECPTPYSAGGGGWSMLQSGASSIARSPGTMSPAPFVNTRYRLAGGMDTPTAAAATAYDQEDCENTSFEDKFRRGWNKNMNEYSQGQSIDGYFPYTPVNLASEGNGRVRVRSSPNGNRDRWRNAVFSVVGGVAGKMWEFCRASAFRGFYAGGGMGYQIKQPEQNQAGEESIHQGMDEKDDFFRTNQRGSTPIPGQFPDEHVPEYAPQGHTPLRPAKRIQREKGEGELRASWVMIPSASTSSSRETSPSRLSTRKLPAASITTKKASMASKAGRRPVLPASRPSMVSHAGSPALHSHRPASFASPRSPSSGPPKHASPASVEALRYAAKIKRGEKEADASMRKLNAQLKAMIKEGREALGSKVEVEDGGVELDDLADEGFVEDAHDYYDDRGNRW
ncbi:MAG: hypothetical protein M1827_003936 [Pycnora praestabilis]|nr:MAG: hypothetical protein M1827_003936 [Pycnora praestabilis]